MRLINTSTLEMEEFTHPAIPFYAILSHTWADEEITLREYEEKRGHRKSGYQKVVDAVALARRLQHAYIWIDTCCIDKTSSEDLTEAINSMYTWYRDAEICLVYLEDLPPLAKAATAAEMTAATAAVLGDCRWFSRGWTLQELVAPRRLAFFDTSWSFRGTKKDHVDMLAQRTRIPASLLLGKTHVSDYSLAGRMAWAAGRQTRRPEDAAYCLMGIFGVYMALAYGEGAKAFRRLQEEIVKHNSDLTIFAWNRQRPENTEEKVAAADLAVAGDGGHDGNRSLPVPYRLPALPALSALDLSLGSLFDTNATTTAEQSEELETPTAPAPQSVPALPAIGSGPYGGAHRRHRTRHEYSLFAPSPESFSHFAGLVSFLEEFENFAVTNRGLFVAGSVNLRIIVRPVLDKGATRATATKETIYAMILGRQGARIVFLPLLKIGPSLFQRDWDTDMVELTDEIVMHLRGVLVSDWYILMDRRPAAETFPLRYREEALHVPRLKEDLLWVTTVGGGRDGDRSDNVTTAGVGVVGIMNAAVPTHLWDEHDYIFLRQKPYGPVHYDAVLVLKYMMAARYGNMQSWKGQHFTATAVVVLCRFRSDQERPAFFVYKEEAYPRETALLQMHRSPHGCVTWQELSVWCPHLERLSDRIVLDVQTVNKTGQGQVQIRVYSVKDRIVLGCGVTDVHSIALEMMPVQ